MQPGESQEASFWGMSVEVGGRMRQFISIQTGLLHDSGVCECLPQRGEFITLVWKNQWEGGQKKSLFDFFHDILRCQD